MKPSAGRRVSGAAVCLFALWLALMPRAHVAGNPANVLAITGTDPYLPALLAANEAMRAEVARRFPRTVAWLYESTDSARFGLPAPTLAELLSRKYQGVNIDVVVLPVRCADRDGQHRDVAGHPDDGLDAVFRIHAGFRGVRSSSVARGAKVLGTTALGRLDRRRHAGSWPVDLNQPLVHMIDFNLSIGR
jgi:hypothetical protein